MHPINVNDHAAHRRFDRCAVVKAQHEGTGKNAKLRLIGDGVFVAANIAMQRIPDRLPVINPAGEIILPSAGKSLWISAETFDPFHLICEG